MVTPKQLAPKITVQVAATFSANARPMSATAWSIVCFFKRYWPLYPVTRYTAPKLPTKFSVLGEGAGGQARHPGRGGRRNGRTEAASDQDFQARATRTSARNRPRIISFA